MFFKSPLKFDFWNFFFPPTCQCCSEILVGNNLFCKECQCKLECAPQKGFVLELANLSLELNEEDTSNYLNLSMVDYSSIGQLFIKIFKYDGFYKVLNSFFSDSYTKLFREAISSYLDSEDLLVPIPLHRSKLRERGFNQALVFANYLSANYGGVTNQLLLRVKNNKAQARQNASNRQKNSENIFRVISEKEKDFSREGVWIVDDVLTTGATAFSAIKTLEACGLKVKGIITLARSGYSFSVQEDWLSETS